MLTIKFLEITYVKLCLILLLLGFSLLTNACNHNEYGYYNSDAYYSDREGYSPLRDDDSYLYNGIQNNRERENNDYNKKVVPGRARNVWDDRSQRSHKVLIKK